MDAMANSAGELEKAYDIYLGSTTAHINQFKAAFEELGANTFNSKMLSDVVDLGTAFTGFANALVKANMLLPTIFAGATIPRITRFILANKAARNEVTTLTQTLLRQKTVNDELTISLAALNKQQLQNIQVSLEQALQTKVLTQAEYTNINATIEQMAVNAELAGSNRTLAASFKAITASIPGWGWVMLSIMAVIGVVGKLTQIAQESRQAFIDSSDAIGNEIDTLRNYKTSIEEIANSTETETEKLQKLNEIRETLNNTYDANIERASSEKDTIASLNKEIDDQIAYRRKLYLIENENKYKNAVRESHDFQSNDFHLGGYTDYKLPVGYNKSIQSRLSESISSLFTTDSLGRMTIGANTKNEIELLKEYESVMVRISKIRSDRMKLGQDLNKAELAVFNNLKKNYEELKNDMSESGYSYDSIMEYAQQKAEDIIATTEQGSMSIEEWREELIRLADGDEYVIEKLRELVDGMTGANDAVEETVDVLAEAYKEMERIQSMLDSLDESMQTAKDIFEDLAKTIKSNNDADKFFTSTEIIDLLDKYPELSNAILETSYGYKIETEALEQLRQAKLAEQKDALAAQIAETESAIESVKKRIDAYTAEVKGVKSLAEAKVELAKIDAAVAKLNSINSATPFATGLENTQKSLEARRKALAGWVGTAEELDKLNESLKKSKMQYTVLGKVFDDVEDKSKDVSKALSDQKNKLKDLADEYKDAQKAIEDLIKLTMDMIKKQKNLEKEALKEQLDNFKKLIEKRKELIDLEKDQYDFEKNLKEQNRDLLAIQQELDALSVEGADYSLEDMKRKAELQQKFNEQSEKRTDFLYDHEVDLRKDALDREEKAFEENINTQTKAIEDYLAHEGWIRAEAIDLINSKSQEFYDNLLNYTQNYTDMAQWEFQNLWNSAYEALMKYGNGAIDVDYTLAYLAGRIAQMDAEMEALENQINNTKNAAQSFTDGFTDGMEGVVKVTEEAIKKMGELQNVNLKNTSWSAQAKDPRYYDTGYTSSYMSNNSSSGHAYWPMSDKLKSLVNTKYHDGGLVKNNGKLDGSEILAKLMTGEVVVTPEQANTFIGSTLPKMITANSITNNSAPTVSIGDINIAGDATESTVTKIKQAQKEIVDNVFKVINNQRRLYTGINI